ncbi:GNAT family N-acetyltransferase [Georgenia sp. Z1344]|uniref:GNAT family N-acetyltransferase n=1 Tax=Georgenia sp. Z1344 TaxID=3416706 RepID=UPI003CE8D67A
MSAAGGTPNPHDVAPDDVLEAGGATYRIGRASAEDVPAIVDLLRDDELGATREQHDLAVYEQAFAAIDRDPSHYLAVVRDGEGVVVGVMQLTLVPGLSRGGALRLHIEAVRVGATTRGSGLGRAMFAWAHDYGRSRSARLVQLTSDKSRTDAHRFYDRLGYRATHEGYKLSLE